jgi:hypothetical protein
MTVDHVPGYGHGQRCGTDVGLDQPHPQRVRATCAQHTGPTDRSVLSMGPKTRALLASSAGPA